MTDTFESITQYNNKFNHLFEKILLSIEKKTNTVFGTYSFGATAKVSLGRLHTAAGFHLSIQSHAPLRQAGNADHTARAEWWCRSGSYHRGSHAAGDRRLLQSSGRCQQGLQREIPQPQEARR